MACGTVILAYLALAIPAGVPEPTYLAQRGFKIPIRLSNERRADVQKLYLYISKDQGKSWERQNEAGPDATHFVFMAPADGSYWFIVSTLNARGDETPRDLLNCAPNQAVVVDTAKPVIRVQAQRRGDEVVMKWSIEEENLDLATFHAEYQTPEGKWYPIAAWADRQGEAAFKPGNSGDVAVRVHLKDRAGNEGEGTASTSANGTMLAGGVVSGGTPGSSIEAVSKLPPAGDPQLRQTEPAKLQGDAKASDNSLFPPSVLPTAASAAPKPPSATNGSGPPSVVEPPTPGRVQPAPDLTSGLGGLAPAPMTSSTDKTLSEKTGSATSSSSAPLAGATRGALPDLQYVNKKQVKLEFDVSRIGPSGLGGVEVYLTADEGLTWNPAPVDGTPLLPVNLDGRAQGPLHGSVAVNLPNERIRYGLCLVVKSRAGLGKPPPQKGEPPQVRLELDQTPPYAALFRPQPDTNRTNTLILSWMAWDRNLTANPVTLEWAERRDGTWQSVSTEPLTNNLPTSAPTGEKPEGPTGTFAWQLPDRIPSRVYLRLKVRDLAGNESVAQTPEPVLIDLTVPEVANVSATVGVR
jgi:hypothetical protein